MHIAPLVYDLAIMLGLAGIVVLLFQRIHQPVVLGYLVAGIILGPHTPPHALVNDIPNIQILSELGVIFLMFSLGLEFSFKKLTRVGFSATVTGVVEVVIMMFVGWWVGRMLGWSNYDCLFLGAALAISSTTIIIKAIDELGLKNKLFAELIFGVLIVEDLLAILLLVGLSTVVITKNIFSFDMILASGQLILVVGGWFLIGYFMMPPIFRRIADYISEETLTIISVALCLTLVCIAASFNYSTALGAFIMGSILAETVLVHRIENLIQPIRDIFAAVFFVSVGMLIDPVVIIDNWPIVLLLSFVTIVGKILTTSLGALLTGQSLSTSLRVGFGMAQVGEFSFIIVSLGLSLGVTSEKLYPLIVAVSGITTFTTPYLIRLSGFLSERLEQKLPSRLKRLLDMYSAWVYRTEAASKDKSILGMVAVRVFVNGIVVAIIFILVHYLVFHKYELYPESSTTANMLLLLLSLGIASPFIWGMLFSLRRVQASQKVKSTLSIALLAVWLFTFIEIAILSLVYFHNWLTLLLFLIIGVLLFYFTYKQLEISYRWFEKQLLRNLHRDKPNMKKRYADLAPWDNHLVAIEVSENSPVVGKTLSQCQIRQKYGINIVGINHGSRLIAAPRGDEVIMAHDKLIVLGKDDQIDAFKHQIEKITKPYSHRDLLDSFVLKPVLLEKGKRFIGKTIRESKIREKVNGLIVGMERHNIRTLNPDPDTVLQEDDLILVVGERDKIDKL